jgi:hypothetical protein
MAVLTGDRHYGFQNSNNLSNSFDPRRYFFTALTNSVTASVVYSTEQDTANKARCMMNRLIAAITTLVVLMYMSPVFAKANEPAVETDAHPISSLIGDWTQFRAGILDKTRQFNKYSDLKASELPLLPHSLIGRWQTETNPSTPGNRLHTKLTLNANHTFRYDLVALTGPLRQQWHFSGKWEVKNQILMLLIDHSTYPGEQVHDILFWRLLHVGGAKLVYVRSGADEMVAMTKKVSRVGS